jgi:hypothetical protein
MTRMPARTTSAFISTHPCRADEGYAAHRSQFSFLGIGRHASGVADPFNGHIDKFRIAHVQRSDGRIETTWNNMSDPGAFAAAEAEEQEGGEPPPLGDAGVVVCLMR